MRNATEESGNRAGELTFKYTSREHFGISAMAYGSGLSLNGFRTASFGSWKGEYYGTCFYRGTE